MESVILKNKLLLEFYIKDKYISLKEIRKLKKVHSLQRPRKVCSTSLHSLKPHTLTKIWAYKVLPNTTVDPRYEISMIHNAHVDNDNIGFGIGVSSTGFAH